MANKPALKAAYDSLLDVARRDEQGNLVIYLYQAQEIAKALAYRGTEPEPDSFVTAFLDGTAECFDKDEPVFPDTSLFTDPRDGEAITARGLLERIRLGKDAKEADRG